MDSVKSKIQKSSNKMAMISMVLCIALIAGLCIPIATLIWYEAIPDADVLALNGFSFYSSTGLQITSNGELKVESWIILVSGLFMLEILFLTNRIFRSISRDLLPFSQENTARLKWIAKLLLFYSIAEPFFKAGLNNLFTPQVTKQASFNVIFMILSLVIFFLSIVFNYGAQLQKLSDETL